jgi:hypothetical protein
LIGRGRALGAALFISGALWPVLAGATDPARTAGETRSSSVEIYVDGSPATVDRMRSAAAETFGRAGLDAIVTASADEALPAGRAKPLARAYVDLRNPLAPRVVVVDGQTERELARRTLAENASLETSIEAATLVLYMVVEALLTSHDTGTTAAPPAVNAGEAEPPAPPPERARPATRAASDAGTAAPASRPRAPDRPVTPSEARDEVPDQGVHSPSWLDLQAGLFVRTTTLDSEHPVAGAGLSLELFGRSTTPELGTILLGAAHLSASPTVANARASIDMYSFRLLPAMRVPFSSALSAVVGVGGGLDAFLIEARPSGAPMSEITKSSAVGATVSALVGVRWRLAERLHASLNAGADVDLSPRAFVVDRGMERHILLELGRVRPSLSLGFALGLTPEAPVAANVR